jgi:hypothetical protein
MDRITDSHEPDEVRLEEMLGQFKPVPSSRFHLMMITAPWQRVKSSNASSSSKKNFALRRLVWGVTGALVLLMVLGIAFIPSIQAIARQIMYSFIPAPSNQIEVQVTMTNPNDLYHYSDPANFPLSVSEVQNMAGFPIKQISHLAEGMNFIGARFDANYDAVILLYHGNAYNLFLSQRPLGNGQDVFSIGESAMVKIVLIGEIQGEFVTGGWKSISTQSTSEPSNPDNSVNITAIWDNDLPQSTLRWQKDSFVYEIRGIGENMPSLNELMTLANELK